MVNARVYACGEAEYLLNKDIREGSEKINLGFHASVYFVRMLGLVLLTVPVTSF